MPQTPRPVEAPRDPAPAPSAGQKDGRATSATAEVPALVPSPPVPAPPVVQPPAAKPRSSGPKIRQTELTDIVKSYDPDADEELLDRAYIYAMRKHQNQVRANGDPYFTHPLEVALILTELQLDAPTIATALLHDVIEDTDTTRAEIDKLFGHHIGSLVEGLTKIKKIEQASKKLEQAENFRKLLIAISSDVRVLLVKLADRLHNLRTLEHMKPASRERTSTETLEIYAPLAGRMGMQSWRDELEELAFRWRSPEAYAAINERLEALERTNPGLIESITTELKAKLEAGGIKAEVKGRRKRPYSVWRKLENRHVMLEQITDIYGFRVIVDSVEECYRVLGLVHTNWQMVPGRFKDYISVPKPNRYQSVHTTVIYPPSQRVELQIRTREMDDVAEHGIAAHALYKDGEAEAAKSGGNGQAADKARLAGPYEWLRHTVNSLRVGVNASEFLENTKRELFQDEVFCFTPRGSLIALPRGATAIDFAFAVHSDIGHNMVGATINGRPTPIETPLKNGDWVQIDTANNAMPKPAWADLAITGRARTLIRRALREAERQGQVTLGRKLLIQWMQAHRIEYSDDKLKAVLARLHHRRPELKSIEYKTVEDALAAIGRRDVEVVDAARAIAPDIVTSELGTTPEARRRNGQDRSQGEDDWFILSSLKGLKFRDAGEVFPDAAPDNGAGVPLPIRGAGEIPVSFAEGGAVPGERIVGVRGPDGGILIFPVHSPKLAHYQGGEWQWIDVAWDIDPEHRQRFKTRLIVTAMNAPGTLGSIAVFIGDTDANIDTVRMLRSGVDFTEMLFEIEVFDDKHLHQIMTGLRQKPAVNKVERVFE